MVVTKAQREALALSKAQKKSKNNLPFASPGNTGLTPSSTTTPPGDSGANATEITPPPHLQRRHPDELLPISQEESDTYSLTTGTPLRASDAAYAFMLDTKGTDDDTFMDDVTTKSGEDGKTPANTTEHGTKGDPVEISDKELFGSDDEAGPALDANPPAKAAVKVEDDNKRTAEDDLFSELGIESQPVKKKPKRDEEFLYAFDTLPFQKDGKETFGHVIIVNNGPMSKMGEWTPTFMNWLQTQAVETTQARYGSALASQLGMTFNNSYPLVDSAGNIIEHEGTKRDGGGYTRRVHCYIFFTPKALSKATWHKMLEAWGKDMRKRTYQESAMRNRVIKIPENFLLSNTHLGDYIGAEGARQFLTWADPTYTRSMRWADNNRPLLSVLWPQGYWSRKNATIIGVTRDMIAKP